MPNDINKLRELVRTGEFLESNFGDEKVRNQWLFDVENYTLTLEPRRQQQVASAIFTLKSYSSSMLRDLGRVRRQNFDILMGFLRSLYNNDTTGKKLIPADSQAVFIVHGHDDSLIDEVKTCIAELGLTPIVLRDQPDKGLTIIEKLEDWLGNCKCVVVLYTPCDVGRAVDTAVDEERARQNVVYEHGLFHGYLGRKRVFALRKGNTVLPGDCSGVIYTSVELLGWQEQLKSNIRAIDH